MSLNNTPAANRLHIVLFGKRNSGKSSLINALTGQDTYSATRHHGRQRGLGLALKIQGYRHLGLLDDPKGVSPWSRSARYSRLARSCCCPHCYILYTRIYIH